MFWQGDKHGGLCTAHSGEELSK